MEVTAAQLAQTRQERAQQIAVAGDLGMLGRRIDTTVSEALVLGLWLQGVRTFFCVFGHGSTEIGEVLRIYQEAGLVRVCGVRSEIEASHAAAGSALGARRKGRGRHFDRSGCPASAGGLHCPSARTGWAFGICSEMRRPKTKARTCSRSLGRNKTPSCGCLAP